MNVSAIIVTRGDVDLVPVLKSLPENWEVLIWDNGAKVVRRRMEQIGLSERIATVLDFSVYGRYAAIECAEHDLIYVQDDDCVVSAPQAIVSALKTEHHGVARFDQNIVVCNMPQPFRHSFYDDHALVGFGACFHRDAPERAFKQWDRVGNWRDDVFRRTCDVVFTALTPRVLVDVPYENLAWCDAPNRMWKQPEHVQERTETLARVLKAKEE